MNIEQVHLSNIGCYPERTFDLENLTIIHGENRTGKSTLVYALFFGLFGGHLNEHLKISDLARIGEPYGIASLVLNKSGEKYQLKRTTGGTPDLVKWSSSKKDWEQIEGYDPGDLRWLVPISPEMASLTSFFREGELIYFLRDMPKYNNTLLQNLVQMGNIFITQSRFRKALQMAKEEKGRYQKQLPEKLVGEKDIEEAVKAADALGKQMEEIDKELQTLTLISSPETLAALEKRSAAAKEAVDETLHEVKKNPTPDTLGREIKELKEALKNTADQAAKKDELQRRMGKNTKALEDIEDDLRMLGKHTGDSKCTLCGNPISQSRFDALVGVKQERKKSIELDFEKTTSELSEINRMMDSRKTLERSLLNKERQLGDREMLEKKRIRQQEEFAETEKTLAAYRSQNPGVDKESEIYVQKQTLEKNRRDIQKKLIDTRVAAEKLKGDYQRFEKNLKLFQKAERDVLVCDVAFKSLENAVKSLNSSLLQQVRENLLNWSDHFDFLSEFDINMKVSQLTPIIQAKGYQYKLNQMSKSERIFLYLMLKLAIGDALSHLGVFILDDPADGLDRKRKALLSRLLTEISAKRQLVVTTNDPDFAEMFDQGCRIDLP